MSPRAALLLILLQACHAAPRASLPGAKPQAPASASTDALRPTLAEIFGDLPPYGEPLALDAVSADGRFALVRWRASGAARSEPRLVAAEARMDPAVGRDLGALTGAAQPSSERAPWVSAWSHSGARLAAGLKGQVFLLDPANGTAVLLVSWTPEPEADPPKEPGAEPAGPKPVALGALSALHFARDDSALWVSDGKELLRFAVPSEAPPAPLGLEQGAFWSAGLEAPIDKLTWSEDRAVAVGKEPLPRATRSPGMEVWRAGEERAVDLADLEEDALLEDGSLSPDGALFFARVVAPQDRPPPTEVPDFLTPRVSHREGRRRLADDPNPPAIAALWSTASGERFALELDELGADASGALRADLRVIGWSRAQPATLYLEALSEDLRERSLWSWTNGVTRRLWHERDPAWFGGPAPKAELSGAPRAELLLFGSEHAAVSTTPGRSQLFALDPRTLAVRQLSSFAGEMTDFTALEEGGVLFLGSGADPGRRELLSLCAEDLAALVREPARPLAPRSYALPEGFLAEVRAARDGARFFVLHERLLAPPELWHAGPEGAFQLTRAAPAGYAELAAPRPERLVLRAPDGALVHGHVYLPAGARLAGGGPPRAAVVFVHGAGYLQNATDSLTRYPRNALFHVRLARLGYVVIDVDYRGSAGYGARFRSDVQGHLGGKDLADLELFVDELVARGLVDPERVGIYGGSYGGFLTLMALFTHPERWTVGCALRAVSDWRSYAPGYTVARLGRPSIDPEAYRRSSPIDHVAGLADPLLLLHGMADDNVFVQDSVRLMEALIDAGKDFEAMLYPSQGHAFEDPAHWLDQYRRIERFLVEHLGPPPGPKPREES
jgi:dienelactone hydrolase